MLFKKLGFLNKASLREVLIFDKVLTLLLINGSHLVET